MNVGKVEVDREELEDYIVKNGTWVSAIPGWVSAAIYGVVVSAAILWYISDAAWPVILPIGALGFMYHIITTYDSKFCQLWNTHEYYRLLHEFGQLKAVELFEELTDDTQPTDSEENKD